jgi:hypothetical protein
MMAIIQEDENSNTSRRRVVKSSERIIAIIREMKTTLSSRLYSLTLVLKCHTRSIYYFSHFKNIKICS